MKTESEYIVTSRLDSDFYKFTMENNFFPEFKDVPVKYSFKNRTDPVNLADHIEEKDLRRELGHVLEIPVKKTELHYLRGTNEYQERMFPETYLENLEKQKLPAYDLAYKRTGPGKKKFTLDFSGPWSPTTHWEIHGLEIVNGLYYKSLMQKLSKFEKDAVFATGTLRLLEKINILKQYPDALISDFGTRRRFNKDWQEYCVLTAAEELGKQFLGTSNVELAMKHSLLPMGTAAHETDMVIAGMASNDHEIRGAHRKVLDLWWNKYGYGLSIALPDTFGSDTGITDMSYAYAHSWKGFRQDSGDPIIFGERVLDFYKKCGVNAKDKMIVFSDGLTVENIVKIFLHFKGRVRTTFGWGTNFTNDLGLKALSLVIKVSEVMGHGAVKLSDNIAKATGKPEDIEIYKRIFRYANTLNNVCVY